MNLPPTLTDAARQPGLFILSPADPTCCSAREVPYSEIYRDANSVIESPAEHIQRAATDHERRHRKSA